MATITVSGTAFANDRSTALTGTARTVEVRVNGASPLTDETDTGDGTWSVTPTVSAGDVVTILFLGETETGNVVTTTDAVANITGVILADAHVAIRSDDGSNATTIADLAAYDNTDDSTNMLFDVTAGALTSEDPNTFLVESGSTFAPGGDVTIGARVSSSTLDLNGTWTAANGETYRIFGDVDFTGGTYTRATTDEIYFDDPTGGGSDTATLILLGAQFSNVQVGTIPSSSGGDSWTFDSFTVHGTITFDKGTLEDGSLTVKGSYVMADGGGMGVSADVTFDGTGAQAITASAVGQTANVTINKASGTLTITGSFDNNGDWTHTAGTVVSTGSTVTFRDGGVTATYDITSNTMSFNNLGVNTLASAAIIRILDDVTIAGNFTLTKGHWDVNGQTMTLGGNYTDGGASTALDNAATSTFILNGTGAQVITPDAGVTWSALTITNTGGTVTFVTFGWTATTLTVSAGASIVFDDAPIFLIVTTLSMIGTAGNLITMRSSSPATQYTFTLTGGATQTVKFVDVQDADSSAGDEIVNMNGVDSGNNTNWEFPDMLVALERGTSRGILRGVLSGV